MRRFLKAINLEGVRETPTDTMSLPEELKGLDRLEFPFEQNHPKAEYVFKDPKERNFGNDFQEGATLGSGKFTVKSYFLKPLKKRMAVKFIHVPHNRYNTDDDNKRRLIELVREITTFRELLYPNVVNCYGVLLHEGQALICMEQMDMSLKEVYVEIHANAKVSTQDDDDKTLTPSDRKAQEQTQVQPMDTDQSPPTSVPRTSSSTSSFGPITSRSFPEELLAYVAVAMVDALAACKEHKIIHRDIKPENVLLNKNGEIKLCDFGEARILHDSLASTFAGTLCYWPPERFQPEKKKFDVRADIWSLGITLVEIVRGSIPYRDHKGNIPNNIILLQNLILQLNTAKLIEETFPVGQFSDETRDFVQKCLNQIEDRPKYDGLKECAFYQKYGSKSNDERNKIVAEMLKNYGLDKRN